MCTVVADISGLVHSLQPQLSPDGVVYYDIDYKVILLFGLTELKAQIKWVHKVRLIIVPVLSKLYRLHGDQGVEKR